MSLQVTALVLLAALMHASWNALLRGGADRMWSMAVMCIAAAIACGLAIPFLPRPDIDSWSYIVVSGVLHLGYSLFLVRTYRSGDLGQTYPIARGSSPVMVATGAALFAGEQLSALSVAGVLLVSGGIISLAFNKRRLDVSSLPYALGTGCFIGAYSVTDGLGVRVSGNAASYTAWMCLLESLLVLATYVAVRGMPSLRGRRETLMAAVGGVVSVLAYGIVILAMMLGPMGPVSALRETSVVFAALLGWLFLGEELTAYRLTACAVIALGAICLGHAPER
jgi:drug/metabolite transporter (DMT)-like permease